MNSTFLCIFKMHCLNFFHQRHESPYSKLKPTEVPFQNIRAHLPWEPTLHQQILDLNSSRELVFPLENILVPRDYKGKTQNT